MIAHLPEAERAWVKAFFGPLNGLTWEVLEAGAARQDQIEAVQPWLARLSGPVSNAPLVLPFYKGANISRWYATTMTREGEQGLRSILRAWLGTSYLSDLGAAAAGDLQADVLRGRFGREVLSFTGPVPQAISLRLTLLARLDAQRPRLARSAPRPVGSIRSDLERALLARDEAGALAHIAELRSTGRLNEENLQFLGVRLRAGLGQWHQIALDHWGIRNLSDLPLPPQTLSDLVEALYRVHIEDLGPDADPDEVLSVFRDEVLQPFPRLFASRHGVRSPRVVKAFILYECLQARPNAGILRSLQALLPTEDGAWIERFLPEAESSDSPRASPSADVTPSPVPAPSPTPPQAAPPEVAVAAPAATPASPETSRDKVREARDHAPDATAAATIVTHTVTEPEVVVDEADTAFDDGQFDRAFEIILSRPLQRKSLMRLLACAQFIGTAETRTRLLEAFDAQPQACADLSADQIQRFEALRPASASEPQNRSSYTPASGWLDWAHRLDAGQWVDEAVTDALDNRAAWETRDLRTNPTHCSAFADLIGNLDGAASQAARQSLPLVVSAFFPEGEPATVPSRVVANVVILLIAMDDAVARADLETLTTAVSALLELGLTPADYLTMVTDLEAVQGQVASYANLAWSLDICETLAVSPTPSAEASEARLRLFLAVIGQCQAFKHRLSGSDFLVIESLTRDFGVNPTSLAGLRPSPGTSAGETFRADLTGKLIGIYTLTTAAGARAKAALEALYPGCAVEVNSDMVSTPSLTNLARTADIFIFAWRSSSHQAFYCIKDALGGREPVYAAGKGTASIINAVREAAT
jgi:hypothetical protein